MTWDSKSFGLPLQDTVAFIFSYYCVDCGILGYDLFNATASIPARAFNKHTE